MAHGNRKLVVLGIPWDVDTEGLKKYMSEYGPLDDVIVMKDRATGRSRGFGYATFSNPEDAEKVASMEHSLNGRVLEVKIATPKEEMNKTPSKKITRIFVARIPSSVTDDTFRRYFEKYGTITDAFMPKDSRAKGHRGIGFVTFENSESVDKVMAEKHELAGSAIAVDRATPKEESIKPAEKSAPSSYSPYGIYTNASQYGAFGGSTFRASQFEPSLYAPYDSRVPDFDSDLGPVGIASGYNAGVAWSPPPALGLVGGASRYGMPAANLPSAYNSGLPASAPSRRGAKIFVGRLPSEATSEDLRRYFINFGRILDVFVPKGTKKMSHRGFGFVTFADEGAAERVIRRRHELLGVEIAVDHAEPPVDSNVGGGEYLGSRSPPAARSDIGGPIRSNALLGGPAYELHGGLDPGYELRRGLDPGYELHGGLDPGYDLHGGLDLNGGWGTYGGVGPIPAGDGLFPIHRASRVEARYRPY
ncbi:hypothetical protein O6H91_11G067000 [Diphasiastrum complanatum]|nr:hypothetical protein O6H91_11G067000 [Diphasiastrum complanatum]